MAIYSELKKLVELDSKIKSLYGDQAFDLNSQKNISWYEVVAIIRFGLDWRSNEQFLKEQNSFGHINPEIFKIKEELIKGQIPFWIKVNS